MLPQDTIAALARELYTARKTRTALRHFSQRFPSMTIDDGYAIQRAWVALEIADGRTIKGRKIGLTSRAMQQAAGSRASYARMEANARRADLLTERELDFIAARDSFYMATVSESGWPYMQHRGGPTGFLHVVNPTTLAFADYKGNRQMLSTGNLAVNDRVCLFFMDYPNRTRLKILEAFAAGGHAHRRR